jgi:hypothetical protein
LRTWMVPVKSSSFGAAGSSSPRRYPNGQTSLRQSDAKSIGVKRGYGAVVVDHSGTSEGCGWSFREVGDIARVRTYCKFESGLFFRRRLPVYCVGVMRRP